MSFNWSKYFCNLGFVKIDDFLAKKGSSLGDGPSNELLIPRVKQKNEIDKYFNKKWSKAWKSYNQARQTKIWFPEPDLKKSLQLLGMQRNNLSRLVQFLTGHNKLKRHKNLQNGVSDPHSCRLCFEEEESSFHVIAECRKTQSYRSEIFKLPAFANLPNSPDWTVSQVNKFLNESQIGNMLGNDWFYQESIVY